jgi:hypothetical protein
MKKIFVFGMAGLFLATSLGWSQQATPIAKHKRVHTRPPYSGSIKTAKPSDQKLLRLQPAAKKKAKAETTSTPVSQSVNH